VLRVLQVNERLLSTCLKNTRKFAKVGQNYTVVAPAQPRADARASSGSGSSKRPKRTR
jgi:hypothetical protein